MAATDADDAKGKSKKGKRYWSEEEDSAEYYSYSASTDRYSTPPREILFVTK